MNNRVAIIDFGSQFTQLIIKKIRSLGVRVQLLSHDASYREADHFKSFIISGSPSSVVEIPSTILRILEVNDKLKSPILGICFGAQALCKHFGGKTVKDRFSEFGSSGVEVINDSKLLEGIWKKGDKHKVWASHSDSMVSIKTEFKVVALGSEGNSISIFENQEKNIYGIQFHPEVNHTEDGVALIRNFLKLSGCDFSHKQPELLSETLALVKNVVRDKSVIMAVSGGVDSTVTAKLLKDSNPKNMRCIFVDTGLMRKNESKKIQSLFEQLDIKLEVSNQSALFLNALSGVTDPEQKRKIIGKTFIDVFESEMKDWQSTDTLLAQGTLYSDIIESGFASNNKDSKIKSHHNVGGLPERMKMKLLEPLKELFKDEVRSLGKLLDIPDEILMRHPFPGPGLAVRIIGEITQERCEILREADDIFIETLKKFNLYDRIWQAFAVLLPIKSVGVKGDSRSYGNLCCLRCINSKDGMTANIFPITELSESNQFWQCLNEASGKITNTLPSISRVTYDLTSKPPGTIEWE